jgi:hypothetical protein
VRKLRAVNKEFKKKKGELENMEENQSSLTRGQKKL